MQRSELTIDLGAIRRTSNACSKCWLGPSLWTVVKANGYGHGAVDVGRAALEAGASALCVATVAEGLELREAFPDIRILVMGPTSTGGEITSAREGGRSSSSSPPARSPKASAFTSSSIPGMGRWGLSELPEPSTAVVGLMSHLASADRDARSPRPRLPASARRPEPYRHLTRHLAN
jgi:alanine racemase